MKYNVLIISLEGKESNTEINFFRGLAIAIDRNEEIKIIALGKQANKNSNKQKLIGLLKDRATEIIDLPLSKTKIFFIGDGDNINDLKSMNRSKKTITIFLTNTLNFSKDNIEKNIIYEKGESFDNVLKTNGNLKNAINFTNNNHKKKTNIKLFDNIIKELENNNKIQKNEEWNVKIHKALKILFKNSSYYKIIKILYNDNRVGEINE